MLDTGERVKQYSEMALEESPFFFCFKTKRERDRDEKRKRIQVIWISCQLVSAVISHLSRQGKMDAFDYFLIHTQNPRSSIWSDAPRSRVQKWINLIGLKERRHFIYIYIFLYDANCETKDLKRGGEKRKVNHTVPDHLSVKKREKRIEAPTSQRDPLRAIRNTGVPPSIIATRQKTGTSQVSAFTGLTKTFFFYPTTYVYYFLYYVFRMRTIVILHISFFLSFFSCNSTCFFILILDVSSLPYNQKYQFDQTFSRKIFHVSPYITMIKLHNTKWHHNSFTYLISSTIPHSQTNIMESCKIAINLNMSHFNLLFSVVLHVLYW